MSGSLRKLQTRPKDTPVARGMAHLYARPGFLLRRCHQISVSIFAELCAGTDLTPAQYGVLYTIGENPDIDQIAIARAIGLDRSTVSSVIDRLVRATLVERCTDARDRRRHVLAITDTGRARLRRAMAATAAAQGELLKPLAAEERRQLLDLLRKLMMAHSEKSRVPFDPHPARRGAKS